MSDLVKYSKEFYGILIDEINHVLSTNSTRKLLAKGVIIISSTFILKSWLKQLIFWKQSKLNGPMPLPIFGNIHLILKMGLTDFQYMMTTYGRTAIYFEGTSSLPIICTSDVDFIKAVTIRDFQYFRNRRVLEGTERIDALKDFLTSLKDDSWKTVRSIMSAGFSSGKLKNMTGTILETCNNFDKYLEKLITEDGILDTNKVYPRLALDVVCSCFFGYEVDTINDAESEFPAMVKKMGSGVTNWRVVLFMMFPKIFSYLSEKDLFSVMDPVATKYVRDISNQIINERKQRKTVRNDFVQIMIDHEEQEATGVSQSNSSKSINKKLTNNQMISQSLLFMLAGTDTTAVALTYISYNLAMNPEIQDKLINEVDSVLEKFVKNNEICYESIKELNFMNDVINESQRMYSVVAFERQASDDYKYKDIEVNKGQTVNVLIDAIHHDETNYPEPFRFKPDREKSNDSFIPFGSGPRSCIAFRFALLEIKLVLTKILSKYRFEKFEKTIEKITTDSSGLQRSAEPILLKVVKRTSIN